MDLSKIPLMAAIKSRMQWLGQNQTVLSANIANADTPGYRPSKLAEQNFSALVEQTSANTRANGVAPVALKATQAGHFGAGQASLDGGAARVEDAKITEIAMDGNAVDLEDQLLAVAQNQMDHGLMVELYRKQVGLMRVAIRGSGNN
ncbi:MULTISPECIES: flagellar basal body rod protein FlgB [unclassified Iodidimonas]|jgi:flagellar basal-body rod protein FlgB|uniref:flagellar basal body rod protein FlgB n=1 Tax=unclassified Iodidimonas TaxID=2626145 RepID=UPI002482D4E6|nr:MULTISPECIES: flagellar basal body rod protein FlgB [unclassified Iodidimonas]